MRTEAGKLGEIICAWFEAGMGIEQGFVKGLEGLNFEQTCIQP